MSNKLFFCRSWVIISDFPLGSNGETWALPTHRRTR
ncbi:hypothetical protein RGQ29_018350 [Quercus rubra]|uniref:Uncharacterized protein n=1 Tax=Quercus rubra TaxID=3512 RepID=A0AAN7FSA5_QUERU|nr:hypothetical protein RGQ29_018350 [Quercus rubra]